MKSRNRNLRPYLILGLAITSGGAITAVDNFASGGEVSPIVIVALLLIATAVVGALAIRRRWIAALAVWIWLPVVHLVKHMLGLPDTLQRNTYSSILLLGVFALTVTVVGTGCGVLVRRSAERLGLERTQHGAMAAIGDRSSFFTLRGVP